MLTSNAPAVAHVQPHTRSRALAAAGGTLAAVAAWIIEVPLLGVGLRIRFGGGHGWGGHGWGAGHGFGGGQVQTIGIGPVIGISLAAGLLGWLLLAVLERRTSRARALWTGAALVALAVSLGLPLSAATTTAATVGLIVMHLAVAAVLIPLMGRTARAR
jgi:hypothetical protein